MPDNAGVFLDYFKNWVFLPIAQVALWAYNERDLKEYGHGIRIVFVSS
ncbi:MAG: hypothetical protein ACYTGA_08705 [Planctomycetota bacterium]|jgi:hypothetical protein